MIPAARMGKVLNTYPQMPLRKTGPRYQCKRAGNGVCNGPSPLIASPHLTVLCRRIRNLESIVSGIQNTVNELLSSMRSNQSQPSPRSIASPSSSGHPNHSSPTYIHYHPSQDSPPIASPHQSHHPPHLANRSMSYPVNDNVSSERDYTPYNPGPHPYPQRRLSGEHRPPSHPSGKCWPGGPPTRS